MKLKALLPLLILAFSLMPMLPVYADSVPIMNVMPSSVVLGTAQNFSISYTGTEPIANVTYWFGDTNSSFVSGNASILYTYSTASFYVTLADVGLDNGTIYQTNVVYVTILPSAQTTGWFNIDVEPTSVIPNWNVVATPTYIGFMVNGVPIGTGIPVSNFTFLWGDGFSNVTSDLNPTTHQYAGVGSYTVNCTAEDIQGNFYFSGNHVVTVSLNPSAFWIHLIAVPNNFNNSTGVVRLSFSANSTITLDNITVHWGYAGGSSETYYNVDPNTFYLDHTYLSYVNTTFIITASAYYNNSAIMTDSAAVYFYQILTGGTGTGAECNTGADYLVDLMFAFVFMMTPAVLLWITMRELEILMESGTFVYITLEGMVLGGFIGMMAGVVPPAVEALIMALFAIVVWRRS